MYHLSFKQLHNKIIYPRVPNNTLTKNRLEDGYIPRICFCPTIEQCLMAIGKNIEGRKFNVYTVLNKNCKIISNDNIIKNAYVPDAEYTKEIWVIEPVKFIKVGRIIVRKALDNPYKYTLRNGMQGECYAWEFDFIN